MSTYFDGTTIFKPDVNEMLATLHRILKRKGVTRSFLKDLGASTIGRAYLLFFQGEKDKAFKVLGLSETEDALSNESACELLLKEEAGETCFLCGTRDPGLTQTQVCPNCGAVQPQEYKTPA